MSENYDIKYKIEEKLKHIHIVQISILQQTHRQDASAQFCLSVCDSVLDTARAYFGAISDDAMTQFADFVYTQHDLIYFNAIHPGAAGLGLNPLQDLSQTQVEVFLNQHPEQQTRKALIAYNRSLYYSDPTQHHLIKINPRYYWYWESHRHLLTRIQQQIPFTTSQNNTGVRQDILNLTTTEVRSKENCDFDMIKRLVITIRDELIVEKNKFHVLHKRGILSSGLGLLGTLSIGLSLYYWPVVLTYLALNSVAANVILLSLQGLRVLFVYLTIGGLLFTAVGCAKEKQIDQGLMDLNHPPALRPSAIDLNRFFSEYEPNLKALFPQTQPEAPLDEVAIDEEAEGDSDTASVGTVDMYRM